MHMLPSPPDLAVAMRPWKERELFWIVKHGFKYTGMPGWVALEREDEIWAVVAFLKKMPTLAPIAIATWRSVRCVYRSAAGANWRPLNRTPRR